MKVLSSPTADCLTTQSFYNWSGRVTDLMVIIFSDNFTAAELTVIDILKKGQVFLQNCHKSIFSNGHRAKKNLGINSCSTYPQLALVWIWWMYHSACIQNRCEEMWVLCRKKYDKLLTKCSKCQKKPQFYHVWAKFQNKTNKYKMTFGFFWHLLFK